MPAPTYNDVFQYARQLQGVSQEAKQAFMLAVKNIDFDDWAVAAEELRTAIYAIVDYYGLATSELGAQWYEYCRSLGIGSGYTAIVGEVSRYSVKSDVDVHIDKLFNGDIDTQMLVSMLEGVVVDQVQKQARDTILENINREYLAAIESGDSDFADNIGYARVTTGDACAFCVLLASRGFVYKSKQTAERTKWGSKYHPNCTCVAVPFHKADSIPGYGDKLEAHDRMYRDADNMRRSGNMPEELKERIADARKKHQEKYDAGETSDRWSSLNEVTIIMRYQNEGLH